MLLLPIKGINWDKVPGILLAPVYNPDFSMYHCNDSHFIRCSWKSVSPLLCGVCPLYWKVQQPQQTHGISRTNSL